VLTPQWTGAADQPQATRTRAVVGSEDQAVALRQHGTGTAGLGAGPPLGERELPAGVVGPILVQPDHDLQGEHQVAEQPTAQGVPVSSPVAQHSCSLLGEHGVDGKGVVHRHQAHEVPGEPEVGPVDVDFRVEPYLAVSLGRRRAVEGHRPRAITDAEGAGHGDALT
jgi:hypothetical protein